MRIVVAAPPKSGNHWIRCLLAETYRLQVIEGDEKGNLPPELFGEWVDSGGFPDGSIIHVHYRFKPELCDVIEAAPATIVTILRDPYDAFVSMFHWQQQRSRLGLDKRQTRPRQRLDGRSIDDPETLDYIRKGFGRTLKQGASWLASGRSHIVRYEDLHRDTAGTLAELAGRIAPPASGRIAAAVGFCSPDAMRERDDRMLWHVRSARPGDAREALGPAHLAACRECHAEAIRVLGYEVR